MLRTEDGLLAAAGLPLSTETHQESSQLCLLRHIVSGLLPNHVYICNYFGFARVHTWPNSIKVCFMSSSLRQLLRHETSPSSPQARLDLEGFDLQVFWREGESSSRKPQQVKLHSEIGPWMTMTWMNEILRRRSTNFSFKSSYFCFEYLGYRFLRTKELWNTYIQPLWWLVLMQSPTINVALS